MNTIKRLVVCLLLLLGSMEVVLAQEKLNGFVINPDSNCPFTIRPGEGEYGFVVINTALSNLNFSIPNAPKRLVKADYKTERQQWILTIVPNDNNYKRYKITINCKGFKQGEIEVLVKQKESQCFDVDPLHENVTEEASGEERIIPQVEVSYFVKSKGAMMDRLYAKVNGLEYAVDFRGNGDPDDFECFDIVEQDDFDGNGITDALIKDTYCGNSIIDYYIVTYHEGGCFSVSNNVAGFHYAIENWKGGKTIVITSSNIGLNYEKKEQKKKDMFTGMTNCN